MSNTAFELYKHAIELDPGIASTHEMMTQHKGNDESYLQNLGLEKKHLKKLQRMGLALCAYTKNIWLPGEQMPNETIVEDKCSYRGKGHMRKWLILTK